MVKPDVREFRFTKEDLCFEERDSPLREERNSLPNTPGFANAVAIVKN